MCELFAISARRPVRANDNLCVFYQDSVWHPHGWGLSWREDGRVLLHKEPVRAIDSSYLSELLEQPICSTNVVAHIRNATKGRLTYQNSHPFLLEDHSGRSWAIAHNGTMLDAHLVERYKACAEGDTDSEQVALYLVDRIDDAIARKGESLSFDERFEVLAREVEALSRGNAINNKLNLLIDDGTYIYLHTNTVNPTLYVRTSGDAAFFCTRPLPDGDGWQEMPTNCLVAYRDGQLVRMAARHEHSIDEEAYLQSIAGMSPVS